MNKDELISIIENEFEANPKAASLEIAKKQGIPFHIIEVIRKMIINGQKLDHFG